MKRKYKMTGCARFFIVLIILAPLAYLGASYYNGEDGIQNIKNLLGIGKERTETPRSDSSDDRQTKRLEDAIDDLEKENRQLKREIEQKDLEIQNLKQRLDAGGE